MHEASGVLSFLRTQLSSDVMNCKIPEMFSSTKCSPHFIGINVGHFGDSKDNDICVNGSNHEFAMSTMSSMGHVEYEACVGFFVGALLCVIPRW